LIQVLLVAVDNITAPVAGQQQIVFMAIRYDSACEFLKLAIPRNPGTYFSFPSEVSLPSLRQYCASINLNTSSAIAFSLV
jgi:hypothetical protein